MSLAAAGVRWLCEQNISPLLVEELVVLGRDATHVRSVGGSSATDWVIVEAPASDVRVGLDGPTWRSA